MHVCNHIQVKGLKNYREVYGADNHGLNSRQYSPNKRVYEVIS